jgi:hypothetical protein
LLELIPKMNLLAFAQTSVNWAGSRYAAALRQAFPAHPRTVWAELQKVFYASVPLTLPS